MRQLLVTAFLFAAAPAVAQSDPAAAGTIRQDATTMLLSAGTHQVEDLIQAAAGFLQCNILFERPEVEPCRPIELQTPLAIDKPAVEEVLGDLLFQRDLVLRPADDKKERFTVVSLLGPRRQELFATPPTRSVAEILARPNLKQPVRTTLTLQNTNSMVATNALRPFFAQAGGPTSGLTFGTAGAPNTMLLSGMQHQVASALTLIRDLDGQTGDEQAPAPLPAPIDALSRRLTELERTVKELQKQLAELQKRQGG